MIISYNHKIDPSIRSMVNVASDKMLRVILYAKHYEKFLPFLSEMGISAATELPIIEGYIVEIPTRILPKLARCRNLRYIAADLDIKACMSHPMDGPIHASYSRSESTEPVALPVLLRMR